VVEKMASLGKLAAVLAHEINNPLAGIRTYARVLRRGLGRPLGDDAVQGPAPLSPPIDADHVLRMMESEAARCGDIVRNMLLFSRESPARFVEERLGPVIDRCLLLLRHQAELLQVSLSSEVAKDLPAIVCDPGQIEQMLLALVMNGLEATPAEGAVRLRAQPEPEGGGIVVSVTDTGCGIPAENQSRIYEPFFTTKPQGKGIGLGLSVVYGIVNRHHGRIELESRPGSTTFTVHLPARPPAEDPGRESSS
jgi:two-component system NtrC family sensor kinase